jgi:8-oxo-dGTP diphosphatase
MDGQTIEIAVAVIADAGGRVLVARRRARDHLGGLWEFPGGKVRAGESVEAACARECREELGAEVLVGGPLAPRVVHRYPERAVAISFLSARLRPESPAPRALAADELRWVTPEELLSLPHPPANRAFIQSLRGPSASS